MREEPTVLSCTYLRQNAGVRMTRTVSSSRRPSSIVTVHTQV